MASRSIVGCAALSDGRERFVRELIVAAFGVELATVGLAEAVEDDDLRRLLDEAEHEIEGILRVPGVVTRDDRKRALRSRVDLRPISSCPKRRLRFEAR